MDEYIVTLVKLVVAFCGTIASAKACLAYAHQLGWI